MNDTLDTPDWVHYLEIPRRTGKSAPMKLDKIMKKRLKAFLKAKAQRNILLKSKE